MIREFAFRKETRSLPKGISSHEAGWLFTDEKGGRLFLCWASCRNEAQLKGLIEEIQQKEPGIAVVDLDTAGLAYSDSNANRRKNGGAL